MLKALEISGFKSFADKTRFEFPAGITVVVGPNGSGKSNIVDAIKWVLGEQSAKSLRGKDMSDVIFKGSTGANSRKPSGSATATIVLDNSQKLFAYDAVEVHVTRRVYQSGESEYLINDEPCRLKDIKSLFRGTGVGTDAYSLIEQGKVERILSSSAKERRAIFEEAAGISRFKAKKIEAQRRLDRVETNLVRLADIVDEVGSRYRSVKNQASKAAKYKDFTDRLQELRTFVGLKDWNSFSGKLSGLESKVSNLEEESTSLNAEIDQGQSEAKESETQLDEISAKIIQQQETANQLRERIAQSESQIELNRSRKSDLTQRLDQLTIQIEKFGKRDSELKDRVQQCQSEFGSAQEQNDSALASLSKLESKNTELANEYQSYSLQAKENQTKRTSLLSLIGELGKQISGHTSQVDSFAHSRQRLQNESEELAALVASRKEQLRTLNAKKEELAQTAAQGDSELSQAQERAERSKSDWNEQRDKLAELNSRNSGLTQRAKVIQELEKKLEGINAGARQLLKQAKTEKQGPAGDVVGLVADLVQVNVKHAAIVDAALGEAAQYVVVDGTRLVEALESEFLKVQGRVGIIQLSKPTTLGADPNMDLSGETGVLGRADKLVHADSRYIEFVRKILGGTWLVKTLADAVRLRQQKSNTVRYVSMDGEVIESDGTIVVGPKSSAVGLVSRRSELRSLSRELDTLQKQIAETKTEVSSMKTKAAADEKQVQKLIGQNTELSQKLAEQNSQAEAAQQQLEETSERLRNTDTELKAASQQLLGLESDLSNKQSQLATQESAVTAILGLVQSAEQGLSTVQTQQRELESQTTHAKVELAKSQQILRDMQSRLEDTEKEIFEHQESHQGLNEQFASSKQGIQAADEFVTTAEGELKKLLERRDAIEDDLTELTQRRVEVDKVRREYSSKLTEQRDRLRKVQDELHHNQMRSKQLVMEREQLASRLHEDYGIEIEKLDAEAAQDEAERAEIDSEITQLRTQIGKIGSVNMDALEELEQLESRYQKLDEQYQDLVNAKEALLKIIQRINTDSRKIFVETLEAIRTNFQKLFRQTFGGGQADIILEEGVDVLEAGIEIMATPPGKPSFNNSLLSGGEKALTAVSLLMAIFQFRPSPFCVLDEVDAPFDEANIGRFVDVLKSFLSWTKFVIVTHSKKTMTAATTLYGVTMQESGVSKRVSVRFEDVSEDGHISDEAIARSDDEAA
jgi:chromosome segregation protein